MKIISTKYLSHLKYPELGHLLQRIPSNNKPHREDCHCQRLFNHGFNFAKAAVQNPYQDEEAPCNNTSGFILQDDSKNE